MPGECRDGMTQHAGAAEREVLLGHGAAKPTASTGRDDEGIYGSHARIYRGIRSLAIVNANDAIAIGIRRWTKGGAEYGYFQRKPLGRVAGHSKGVGDRQFCQSSGRTGVTISS